MRWFNNLSDPPADGQTVWVRQTWFSAAVQATYTSTAATFTLADARVMPFWSIWRWRPL